MISNLTNYFSNNKNSGLLISLAMLFICLVQFVLYRICIGYDFPYHFNRLFMLVESLKEGAFPVYMDYYVLDGYGYLVKNFYSDFLLIPFALLSFIIGIKESFNAMILTSTFLCGIFCFYGFKAIKDNNFGALMFALLFSTASYRFFDLYQRGAYGEGLAITFLPLVFWGLYEVLVGNYKKFYLLSIGMSLLIYTHSLTSFVVVICCLFAFVFSIKNILKEKERFTYLIISVLVTIFLSLYYILPYIQLVLNDTYKFSKPGFGELYTDKFNFVFGGLFRLFENQTAAYSPKIGLLVTFPPLLLRCLVSRTDSILIRKSDPILLIGLIWIAMCTHFFPWHIFPFTTLAVIQFSYRFFPFITLLLTFCTAIYFIVLANKRSKKRMVFSLFLFLILLGMSGESAYYNNFTCGNSIQHIDVDSNHHALLGGEFLPMNFNDSTDYYTNVRGRYSIEYQNESTQITNIEKAKGSLSFDLNVAKSDTLILPLTYYLGYDVMLNNTNIDYFSTNGLMTIVSSQSGHLSTNYVGSPLQIIGFVISIISFLLLFIYIYKKKNNLKKQLQ